MDYPSVKQSFMQLFVSHPLVVDLDPLLKVLDHVRRRGRALRRTDDILNQIRGIRNDPLGPGRVRIAYQQCAHNHYHSFHLYCSFSCEWFRGYSTR